MIYQVLAQKYRPQSFNDILGQEVIARTLKNSIAKKRIANAYIFCGPRGVGKTSLARLVSKMLNCAEPKDDSPCNKCPSCIEISNSSSMDVLEIDGASNRGIDEIRALRENVKFSPSRGKYKIYIIDEVHMLTPEAFNALLKTLEEPPPHVKFIFATTEAHKVMPTILSRCQKFDFKRISPGVILKSIGTIAEKEKIKIDEKAAVVIARSADGSLRDALVILDQMISFSEGKITEDDVFDLLGMISKDTVANLSKAVIESNTAEVVKILDSLIASGKDPVFIANSLLDHYRDIAVIKAAKEPTSDMAFAEDELARIKDQCEKLRMEEILYIIQTISQSLVLMKGTMFTRGPIEIALIRLSMRGNIFSIPEIINNLGSAEYSGEETAHSQIPPPASAKNEDASDIKDGLSHWKGVLNFIKNKKMSVYTFIDEGKLLEFNSEKIVLGFGKNRAFNKEVLEAASSVDVINEGLMSVIGKTPKVEFKILEFLEGGVKDDPAIKIKAEKEKEIIKPMIEKTMDVFGGHVVREFRDE